jgi:hypothetical protein
MKDINEAACDWFGAGVETENQLLRGSINAQIRLCANLSDQVDEIHVTTNLIDLMAKEQDNIKRHYNRKMIFSLFVELMQSSWMYEDIRGRIDEELNNFLDLFDKEYPEAVTLKEYREVKLEFIKWLDQFSEDYKR